MTQEGILDVIVASIVISPWRTRFIYDARSGTASNSEQVRSLSTNHMEFYFTLVHRSSFISHHVTSLF